MSYWNYRVVEKNVKDKIDCSGASRNAGIIEYDTTTYEIHEVYYDEDGNITMWSAEPITGYGEGCLKDLEVDLKFMVEACNKPILKIRDLEVAIKDVNK